MKSIQIFLTVLVLCFAAACSKDSTESDPNPPTPPVQEDAISVTPSILTFDALGGTQTIQIICSDNKSWTLSGEVPWCEVSTMKGTNGTNITFTTQENASVDERNATYTFVCGQASAKLTIIQKQRDALTITSSKIEVPASGETITIEVQSNIQFDYEIADKDRDWILPVETRAMQTTYLTFKVQPNENVSRREGAIIIKSEKVSETVNIYQNGETPSIVLTQSDYAVSNEGETIKVEVSSNVDYQIKMPDVDWIIENKTRSLSTHTHYYTITPNDTPNDRSAQVIYYSLQADIADTLTIHQFQKDVILIDDTFFGVPSQKNTLSINCYANVEYQIIPQCDWIHIYKEGRDEFSLKIDENREAETRNGIVKVLLNNKEEAYTINIYQAPQGITSTISVVPYTTTDDTIINFGKIDWNPCEIIYNSYENNQGIVLLKGNPTDIWSYTFSSKLRSVIIPNSVTTINGNAFKDCKRLESVRMSNNITSIGDSAFENCYMLQSIKIPDRVTSIGEKAFSGCRMLETINIPDGISQIKESTFYDCRTLKSIVIPNNITVIGKLAFAHCYLLQSIKIPDSVVSIGAEAFAYCNNTKLIEISFPVNVSSSYVLSHYYPFKNCAGTLIVRGTIPNPYNYVNGKDGIFSKSNFTTVIIEKDVTRIGAAAFCGCDKLKTIYCKPTIPPTMGMHAFLTNSTKTFYVPQESLRLYQISDRWEVYASSMVGYSFNKE